MSMYSKETLRLMIDGMLSAELQFDAIHASEINIKNAMKRVCGGLIKGGILQRYEGIVLDEQLNMHVTVVDVDGAQYDFVLYYGQ